MVSRRMVLGAGFGGVALVAAGGIWRVTRVPETAYKPWQLTRSPPEDVRLDAFRHAILAPNPHNRQPWTIRLIGQDKAELRCDLNKRLPVTDPFDRQITIGFGTFLELARMAAAERGYRMNIEPFPAGEAEPRLDSDPIAGLTFVQDSAVERDPLFDAIPIRRSNKEVYDLTQTVEPEKLRSIAARGGSFSSDPELIARLRKHILTGIETELLTHDANMESVELMRIGYDEIDTNPDGIDLGGPMIEAGKLAGQIDREQLADPDSQASQIGRDQMAETYGSIGALYWIVTPTNSRPDQLEAGRQYVRANLQATKLGLSMHPMSQTLQEYDEVAESYEKVHQILGTSGTERVQMLARLGYGPSIGPSPRWPLEAHLEA